LTYYVNICGYPENSPCTGQDKSATHGYAYSDKDKSCYVMSARGDGKLQRYSEGVVLNYPEAIISGRRFALRYVVKCDPTVEETKFTGVMDAPTWVGTYYVFNVTSKYACEQK
jgi:hypothetical protein